MKRLFLLLVFLSLPVFAHDLHSSHEGHEELASDKPVPGASIYNLEGLWTNQNGEEKMLHSLAGRPRLVTMLYTRCKTACPLIVDEIQKVLSALPNKGLNFQVSLFSLDAELEKPETMQAFIKKRSLTPNWSVFKSDKDGVANLAAALGVRYKKLKNGEYIHSNSIYLLDDKGVLVAQKEGFGTANKEFTNQVQQWAKKDKK